MLDRPEKFREDMSMALIDPPVRLDEEKRTAVGFVNDKEKGLARVEMSYVFGRHELSRDELKSVFRGEEVEISSWSGNTKVRLDYADGHASLALAQSKQDMRARDLDASFGPVLRRDAERSREGGFER